MVCFESAVLVNFVSYAHTFFGHKLLFLNLVIQSQSFIKWKYLIERFPDYTCGGDSQKANRYKKFGVWCG